MFCAEVQGRFNSDVNFAYFALDGCVQPKMVYSEKQYAYYLELARTACSPSSFVGSDMRYSSEFEVLEAELGKAHSIHGAGLPDWQKISEISECILREHSKDLRVAAWLT